MRYNLWINGVDINIIPGGYSGKVVADIISEARKQGLDVRISVNRTPVNDGGENATTKGWREARLAEREAKDASS